jgi:hypothetical protein
MKTFNKILIALFMASLAVTASATEKPKTATSDVKDMAVVVRTVKSVDYKAGAAAFKPAQRGQSLASGDLVKTADQSFAILRFIDGSVVRVQESSQIKVRGDKNAQGTLTEKTVDMDFGKIGFNVKSRPGEQFRFSSPTAVASIKGTTGAFITTSDMTSLTIVEGSAELEGKNGKKFNVGPGQTAFIGNNGESGVRNATQPEIQSSSIEAKTGTIEIKFRDKNGTIQTINVTPQ